MFLRHKIRREDGKEHRWSVVENRRVEGGRVVNARCYTSAKSTTASGGLEPRDRGLRRRGTIGADRAVPRGPAQVLDCDVVSIRLSGIRLRRPRHSLREAGFICNPRLKKGRVGAKE
jgi:hypothetical protein